MRSEPFGLNDGCEDIVTAQHLDMNFLHGIARRSPVIAVADLYLPLEGQSELIDDQSRQDKSSRSAIDDSIDRHPTDLVRSQRALECLHKVGEVGNFKLDRKASNAVGSFGFHEIDSGSPVSRR